MSGLIHMELSYEFYIETFPDLLLIRAPSGAVGALYLIDCRLRGGIRTV